MSLPLNDHHCHLTGMPLTEESVARELKLYEAEHPSEPLKTLPGHLWLDASNVDVLIRNVQRILRCTYQQAINLYLNSTRFKK